MQLLGGGGSIQEGRGKGGGLIIDNRNEVRLLSSVKRRKAVLQCVCARAQFLVRLSSDIGDRFVTDPSCYHEFCTNA